MKNVKDADVARWTEGGLSLEDLPEMLGMLVLEDAEMRTVFATGNMMLAGKLNKAARLAHPPPKTEPIIGQTQQEAASGGSSAKRHFGDFPFKGHH